MIKNWIKNTLIRNGKLSGRKLNIEYFKKHGYTKYYNKIVETTNFLPVDCLFSQRIWHIIHEIYKPVLCANPSCPNPTNFIKYSKGYFKTCSSRCSQINPETREKIKKTMNERYGGYPLQSKVLTEKIKNTMKKKFGVDHPLKSNKIKKRRKLTYIKNWGVDNPQKSDIVKNKTKETVYRKYGGFTLESQMLKTKFENTCKERYGTKNPVFSSTVKKRISNGVKRKLDQIQMKYSLTNLQRYGVKNPFQSSVIREQIRKSYIIQSYMKKLPLITENLIPLFSVNELNGLREKKNEVLTVVLYEFKCKFCGTVFKSHMYNKLPKCPKCFPKPVSLVEIEIENFISSIYFSKIIKHERSILRGKELDFYLPDKKLAIEYDSFYYHSELSGGKDKYYHLNKTLECEKQGIRLIHIFEDEWLYKQKIVKSKLCDTLGLYDNDVNKCKVVEISTKTKNEFLNQYHIQGEDNSSIKLGVFCLEKLVGVMTFNRYGDDGEFVLSRFVGSKINSQYLIFLLLNFFIERHTPAKIIAYIDKRWDSGILYEKSGFKRVDGKPPNYWYVKNGRRISVLKNLDWRLNGYDRIWDCGISTYEWNLVKNSVV